MSDANTTTVATEGPEPDKPEDSGRPEAPSGPSKNPAYVKARKRKIVMMLAIVFVVCASTMVIMVGMDDKTNTAMYECFEIVEGMGITDPEQISQEATNCLQAKGVISP